MNENNSLENIKKISLKELFISFLKIGATGFGGPAIVVYMKKMVVDEKKWLKEATFSDGVAISQTVPGVISMQTAAYTGLRLKGIRGALASFIGFGLPAFILMVVLSALYVQFHNLPKVIATFNGLHMIVVAIIANAAVSFGKSTLKNWKDLFIIIICTVIYFLGVSPFFVICISAFLGIIIYPNSKSNIEKKNTNGVFKLDKPFVMLLLTSIIFFVLLFILNHNYCRLAMLMSKIDFMAFGGGFASVPLMFHEFVDVMKWINYSVFFDGIALGQLTPGPVAITATFVGYIVYGFFGSIFATIGIFLPSFLIITGITPYFDRLRHFLVFDKIIKAILCSFVALLVFVTYKFAAVIHWNAVKIAFAFVSFLALYLNIKIYWIILAGIIISLFIF